MRRFALGAEPAADARDLRDAATRLQATWQASVTQWQLSGRPLPIYRRSMMSGRVRRLSDDF